MDVLKKLFEQHFRFPVTRLQPLQGQLGAGKTHLVRAIAEGLDVADRRAVTSPTFVLIQEYEARLPIYHFDAYRLKTSRDFADLGVHEYFAGDGVCLVEWADRVRDRLPPAAIEVHLKIASPELRTLRMIRPKSRRRA